jgi:hypothetical protein
VIDIFTSEDMENSEESSEETSEEMENISLCIFQYLTLYYITNRE